MIKKILGLLFIFTSTLMLEANASENVSIVPKPQSITLDNSEFKITSKTKITFVKEAKSVAVLIKEFLATGSSLKLKYKQSNRAITNTIHLSKDTSLAKEAYTLSINKKGIQLAAATDIGWFYAFQSLKQLFPVDFAYANNKQSSVSVQGLDIEDAPRFRWRSFMLDEARHFKGTEQVKKLLDEMAMLKMNVFHWHLVDDQGWRIEIKKYPKLTEIGSVRKSSQVGPLKWDSNINSGEVHEGFYTQEDIKEIVDYAQSLKITIVPEIGMPGHSAAAIASYAWLGTHKTPIDIPTKFGQRHVTDVYDVTDPKVFEFITNVLDEVMALFPSQVIHIGGDEVKYKHWNSSEHIQKFIQDKGLAGPADLQIYFTNQVSQYLNSKNRSMMGWNDILGQKIHDYHNDEDNKTSVKLSLDTVVHFWKGDVSLATQAASDGYDIVNSFHKYTYLDYNYEKTPLSKAYSFDPIPDGLAEKYHHKVVGMGTQMWSEWIPTVGQMDYMIFPRIAAYAEIAWTEKENKNFKEFQQRLKNLHTRWDLKGIYYAPNSDVEKQINETK